MLRFPVSLSLVVAAAGLEERIGSVETLSVLPKARGRRVGAVLVAVVSCWLAAIAPAARANEHAFTADLVGDFVFGACPAEAPSGAQCLHDHLSGTMTDVGKAAGEFDVVIDSAHMGPDGCAPADKNGSFVAPDGGRLGVMARGSYCFATSSASYHYVLKGLTGRFAGASGNGSWTVPAPSSLNGMGGSGAEQIRGVIAGVGSAGPSGTPAPPSTPPATTTQPAANGPAIKTRLRVTSAALSGRCGHIRVIGNAPLRGLVIRVHARTARGPVRGVSRRIELRGARTVGICLRARARGRARYAAVATGYDAAGHRVTASRNFQAGRR